MNRGSLALQANALQANALQANALQANALTTRPLFGLSVMDKFLLLGVLMQLSYYIIQSFLSASYFESSESLCWIF